TRRDFGRPLIFGDVVRWFSQDDPLVIAELTGRQIAQLLEPYVRQMHGWQTPASLVLYPGGLDVTLAPQRSEAASLRLAGTPESLQDGRAYSLWMTRYHRFGGGGLAARALIEPAQPARLLPLTLRAAVLEFLADPAAPLPDACGSILSRQVPERRTRRARTRPAVRHPPGGAVKKMDLGVRLGYPGFIWIAPAGAPLLAHVLAGGVHTNHTN
ncbi:MAG: 5'-nucleotidase C-terminal domain-containing protein, partial [SAR324 cluster bacterium]